MGPLLILLGGLAAAQPAWSASVDGHVVPDEMTVADTVLPLASCALREESIADLYVVALYLPPQAEPRQAVREDVAKGVLVQVVYEGRVPDAVPDDWSEALREELDSEMRAALQDAYADVKTGDVIAVAYTPDSGTTITIGGRQVAAQPGDGPIAALLEMWVGVRPVSADLKRLLLTPGC